MFEVDRITEVLQF